MHILIKSTKVTDFIAKFKNLTINTLHSNEVKFARLTVLAFIIGFPAIYGQPYGNEWIDYTKTYYKIPVIETKICRIPQSTLAAYGLATVPVEHFQLWRDGKEVPLFTSVAAGNLPANGFIEFISKKNDGNLDTELFTDANAHVNKDRSYFNDSAWYFLTINATGINKRFSRGTNNGLNTSIQPDSFYNFRQNLMENEGYYAQGGALVIGGQPIRSANFEQGEGFIGQPFNYDYPTNKKITSMKAFSKGTPMKLEITFAGNFNDSRWVKVKLNGGHFDSLYNNQYQLTKRTYKSISLDSIRNDELLFTFSSNNTTWNENVALYGMYLTYPRKFHFSNSIPTPFVLDSSFDSVQIRCSGVPMHGYNPLLFDWVQLIRYEGIVKQDSAIFLLPPSETERNLTIAPQHPSFIKTITQLFPKQFVNLTQTANQGDYIIITGQIMTSGSTNYVEAYRQYRSSAKGGNYNAKVYLMDEIADQFAYGIRKHPVGIRHFLMYALKKFATTPKMAFLLGHGCNYQYNISDHSAKFEQLNAVPTFGSPMSDNLLATDSHINPTPKIPIGRLSAINPEEVKNYLQKVMDYEDLQNQVPLYAGTTDWRKRVLHLAGGDDPFLTSVVNNFFTTYNASVAPAPLGANVGFFKRSGNTNFANDMQKIDNSINDGVGLITYFGHSSSSSIDFNLGSPDGHVMEKGKYPVIIANGCKAGDIFGGTDGRMISNKQSISESFIHASKGGAIAFISNSDWGLLNYLNLMTTEWYKASTITHAGKTLGEIQQAAIAKAYAVTGSSDFYNRCNLEQVILHADPALKLWQVPQPDYAVDAQQITTLPNPINSNCDSIKVKIKFANIGKATNDSVWLKVHHLHADGTKAELLFKKLPPLYNNDSLDISASLKGIIDTGWNKIVVKIDPDNVYSELTENNNEAVFEFNVQKAAIQPIFPYPFSIAKGNVLFTASTPNAFEGLKTYRIELDTSANFNSPILQQLDTTTYGGIVQWNPSKPLIANTVHYWRTAEKIAGGYHNWAGASFLYTNQNKQGFNQSHFYQFITDGQDAMHINNNRLFYFGNKYHNLYASHGIYNTSGEEESHFSITVNGAMNIRSACIGQSIIFNVFDSLTFKQWENVAGGKYGSAGYCGPGREFNFEFYYHDHSNRKKIMDFIDSIPKGSYVAARLVLDWPHDSAQIKYWKNDTLIYGKEKSLYHALVKQGFYSLDSLNKPRTFFFVCRKDDSLHFKPFIKFSDGLYDRITTSAYTPASDTIGTYLSPIFGPATTWKSANWSSQNLPNQGATDANFWIDGINKNGTSTRLKHYKNLSDSISISDIPADTYPMLQFGYNSKNTDNRIPTQLRQWQVLYDPLPDGALTIAENFTSDNAALKKGKDNLTVKAVFKNIQQLPLGSCFYRVLLLNAANEKLVLQSGYLKALSQWNDTAMIAIQITSDTLLGDYRLAIEVNPDKQLLEQYNFNNNALFLFKVYEPVLPITLQSFAATAIAPHIQLSWTMEENKAIGSYSLYQCTDGQNFASIQSFQSNKNTTSPTKYEWLHTHPGTGKHFYRLSWTTLDGKIGISPIKTVQLKDAFELTAQPNPFTQQINITTNQPAITWQIQMMLPGGQKLLQIKGKGNKSISTTHFLPGTYWLKWETGNESGIISLIKK